MLAPSERGSRAITFDDAPPPPQSRPAVPLSVAILCGGASRRMGSDKALLSLQPGTPPMLALVIDRVRGLSEDLFLVGIGRPGYEQFGVPLIEDRHSHAGPLGGIATALMVTRHSHCLVVACDMPFLNPALLAWMAAVPRDRYDVLVPVIVNVTLEASPRPVQQPLHAIYSRACLPAIERQLQSGDRRVTGIYADVRVMTLTNDQFGADARTLRSFFSADTPEAIAQARAWLAK